MRRGHRVNGLFPAGDSPPWRSLCTPGSAWCEHVERELALVKVAGVGEHRIEALRLAEVFRANVVDTTIASFVFEVTGASTKIDRFVELMGEIGLVEVARTGIVAMARGKTAV